MKKIISVICLLLAAALIFPSCSKNTENGDDSTMPDTNNTADVTETTSEITTESTENKRPESFKVLATGYSLIHNCVTYLTSISKDLGTDMTVGLVWRGDSTFKTYVDMYNIPYRFVYSKGNRTDFSDASNVSEKTVLDALADDDWNIVTINQGFLYSDYPDSSADLPRLVEIIRSVCPNTPIYHNLTPTYMDGCPNALFTKEFNGSTDRMYENFVDDAQKNILSNPEIEGLIPTATLLKSLMTSKYKDMLYAGDKVHLGPYGAYAAGILWYSVLTGASVEGLKWKPAGVDAEFRDFVVELVPKIIASPFYIVDYGMRDSDAEPSTDGIELKAEISVCNGLDGGYLAKSDDFIITENGQGGVDVSSQYGANPRCIWAFSNDLIEKYPILNFGIWESGISNICITKLWNDGIGDIELELKNGTNAVNILELLNGQNVESIGYTYITVYTASTTPVRITHFCLMATSAE